MTYNCAVCNLTNKNNRNHVMCCKCYEIFHVDNCAKVYEKFSKLCIFKAKLNYGDDFDANCDKYINYNVLQNIYDCLNDTANYDIFWKKINDDEKIQLIELRERIKIFLDMTKSTAPAPAPQLELIIPSDIMILCKNVVFKSENTLPYKCFECYKSECIMPLFP
jgi:hypothetical protein